MSSRQRGRGRGHAKTSSKAVKALENKNFKWATFVPPLRQPTVNTNFTLPITILVDHTFNGGGKDRQVSIVRVENIILRALAIVALPSKWRLQTRVRIFRVSLYGLLDDTSSASWMLAPSMTVTIYDPITNVEVKQDAALGTLVTPPRLGFHFPSAVKQHALGWHTGVTGASNKVVGISTKNDITVAAYFEVVLSIDEIITGTEVPWDDTIEDFVAI